ncbi:hypothetical protein HK097_002321 [Rhizophlyctis rosea]|uniref:Uncharacterized protein n=1 Tax=Rhizophlyctis rosea TaxID=64517 RepID=A0AAD5SLH5_9FUNG|nr:hypothetical protein HK097_002321 [Rhizophlyctis rosea]
MTHVETESHAPYAHFLRDLPDPAIHAILRVHVTQDLLLRCDTVAYGRLCKVDRFFYYTMRQAVKQNLMILQAKREEYLARFPHLPHEFYLMNSGRYHIRRLLKNPFFNYSTYLSHFLSTFGTHNWKWETYMVQFGRYFAQAAPFLSYNPRPKTLTYIEKRPMPDPTTNKHPTFTTTYHAQETFEVQSGQNANMRCLFFKKFVYTPNEEDPTNDQDIKACEFLCAVINGELRPDGQDADTVSAQLPELGALCLFPVNSKGTGPAIICSDVTVKLRSF